MALDELLREYNEGHPAGLVGSRRSECGDVVLELSGELEMKAATDIAPLLSAVLHECPARGRLVLDLRGVGYISSTGVGLLSTVMIAAERRSVRLVLLDMPARIRKIMDTLGLLSFFCLEESDE